MPYRYCCITWILDKFKILMILNITNNINIPKEMRSRKLKLKYLDKYNCLMNK